MSPGHLPRRVGVLGPAGLARMSSEGKAMSTTGGPAGRAKTIPRSRMIALGLLAWLVGLPLGHSVLPWAVSTLAARHGWSGGRPGAWNLLGLAPLAAGAAVLAWAFACGLARVREIPDRLDGLASPFLMNRGPYAFSRNPMYVAELALWLGWAILFGSIPVAIGLALLGATVRLIVPIEERGLAARFGEPYRRYAARVPRWLGRPRRDPDDPSLASAPDR